MAASRQKSDDRTRGVQFTAESARAIAETVRTVQGGNRGQSSLKGSGSVQAAAHYLSKTTSAWQKGSTQTLTIYVGEMGSEAASSGDTVTAVNKFANVASGKWVMLARCNAGFYLIAAEC